MIDRIRVGAEVLAAYGIPKRIIAVPAPLKKGFVHSSGSWIKSLPFPIRDNRSAAPIPSIPIVYETLNPSIAGPT